MKRSKTALVTRRCDAVTLHLWEMKERNGWNLVDHPVLSRVDRWMPWVFGIGGVVGSAIVVWVKRG